MRDKRLRPRDRSDAAPARCLSRDVCGPTRKRRYRSKRGAEQALDPTRRARTEHGDSRRMEQRVYSCPHCAGWHLTKLD